MTLGGAIDTNGEAFAAFSSAAADFGVPNAGQFNGIGHIAAVLSRVLPGFLIVPNPTGDADTDTAALQAAAATGRSFFVTDGDWALNAAITLQSNQTAYIATGATLTQTALSTNIFRAVGANNAWVVNDGALVGEGTWSAAWTGMSGHEDRAAQFINCTRSGIVGNGVIRDCGSAGVALIGGSGLTVRHRIEGTNDYSTPIPAGDNFQVGVYVLHGTTYGATTDVLIDADVSGTAQGHLVEKESGVDTTDARVRIRGVAHDIPGQHGAYLQAGGIDCRIQTWNTNLAGVKLQSQASNTDDLSGFLVDVVARNAGSQAFEVAVPAPGTGSISNVQARVVAVGCQRGCTIDGRTRGAVISVTCDDATQYGALLDGAELHDIDLTLVSRTSGRDGVLVTCTDSDGIRVKATVRNPSGEGAGLYDGITIQSASVTIDLIDPDVTDDRWEASPDDGRLMRYGIFNETAGAVVRILGSCRATMALTQAVRSVAALLAFPANATLSAGAADSALADITALNAFTDAGLIQSGNDVLFKARTTTGSAATAWYLTLEDESAYTITVELTGKLAGGAERASYVYSLLAYRNGAGAVIEGTPDLIASTVSGGFGGVVAWDASGNNVRLRLHSGSAVTTDWTVRARVTAVVD